MKIEAKGYCLKEYGSWSVLIISFLIGLGVSRAFSWAAVPLFLSLGLLVNSKQAFTKWVRKVSDCVSLGVFLAHIGVAAAIMILIFGSHISILLRLLIFPVAYLLSSKLAGEHSIFTELLGFALLSLAAVLAKFLLAGGVDVRLFAGAAFYFSAGVFKIKTLLLRKTKDRIFTVAWVILTIFVYLRMHIPLIILLPLADNLIVTALPYRLKLKTTGWIEVAKGLTFLVLFIYYY